MLYLLTSTLRGLICNDGNPLKCFLLEQKSAHEITWYDQFILYFSSS